MDDIYAINLAKTIFREGFNAGDIEMDSCRSTLTPTRTCRFGLPSFYYSDARDVFRTRLVRLFGDYSASMKVIIIDVVLNGDRAFDWGWHILDLTSKMEGSVLQVRSRYFETWRRDAMRGWLITSFIDNLDQPPRMPEDVIEEIHDQ